VKQLHFEIVTSSFEQVLAGGVKLDSLQKVLNSIVVEGCLLVDGKNEFVSCIENPNIRQRGVSDVERLLFSNNNRGSKNINGRLLAASGTGFPTWAEFTPFVSI